mmetsp:Transcript_22601/g.35817  ORF Transcript_22601/g.35817 Transcript_22601/m.35817 type:complete len:288 (+) Transcript_22601:42-905(+)
MSDQNRSPRCAYTVTVYDEAELDRPHRVTVGTHFFPQSSSVVLGWLSSCLGCRVTGAWLLLPEECELSSVPLAETFPLNDRAIIVVARNGFLPAADTAHRIVRSRLAGKATPESRSRSVTPPRVSRSESVTRCRSPRFDRSPSCSETVGHTRSPRLDSTLSGGNHRRNNLQDGGLECWARSEAAIMRAFMLSPDTLKAPPTLLQALASNNALESMGGESSFSKAQIAERCLEVSKASQCSAMSILSEDVPQADAPVNLEELIPPSHITRPGAALRVGRSTWGHIACL